MPWVKIGVSAVGVSLIALYAIPATIGNTAKIVWFLIAYLAFDAAYTILDTPSFALTTVMTSNVEERTEIIAGNKLWSMVGGVLAVLLIPMIRPYLGWAWSCVAFVIVSVGMMIPMMFTVKERHVGTQEKTEEPTFKEMLNYLKHNKYLLIALLAMLILGAAGITFSLQCFIAKLKNTLVDEIILLSLAAIGFIEGENAIQPAGVDTGVWALFNLIPAIGFTIALIVLRCFYKLRATDVQVMAKYNNGEISRAEAEAVLAEKFGPAAK